MSLVKKGLSQPTIKKPSPLHSSDSAFNVLKFTNRPNTTTGTIGNPTYLNKVYSRDKPNNSLKGSPKLPSSPTNTHSKFKRPDSNTVTEINSPNKLRPDKKHYSDKDQLTLKQKTKSANKAGSRYNAQGNMNSQDVIDLSYCDPKSVFRQKGKQSATSSRKLLHEDLKDRSLLSELSMGWTKSVSYGIADVETPASTRKVLKPIEQKNKKPAPILIVNCELDLKGEKEKEKAKETKKEIESVKTPVNTRKRQDKEASSKKTSPNKDIQSLNVSKQVSPTKIIQKTQKSEVKTKGKENKENKSAVKKVKEKEEKTPTLKPAKLISKKSPKKEPISKPFNQLKEPKESKEVSMEVQEPKSLTNISRINLETSLDTSILSSSFMKDIRPSTAKLPGSMNSLTSLNSIASTKSYFTSKAMNTKPRQTSPSTKTSPSLGIETNPNTEESLNIQPSKNSEFSFKMTYFKPIEDHALDKYIREINQSQSLKKKLDTVAPITSTNNTTIEKHPETFCPPLPSSQALETQRPGELSKQNSIILEEPIQAHHKKSFSTAKKVPSIQTKNPNNLAVKSSIQDLSVKAQKVLDSHPKGGRESLEEIAKDFNKPGSPLAKEKYAITLAERVVRDEKIKLEAKIKNNFSKLDRILQEMKENPSISMTDENIAPHLGDADGGLFNQGSRVESSSSTNCSLNRSFANTLRKIAVSHSEY